MSGGVVRVDQDSVWEFYFDGDKPSWGWRCRPRDASASSQSTKTFRTFTDCYVDAISHGFDAKLSRFTPYRVAQL